MTYQSTILKVVQHADAPLTRDAVYDLVSADRCSRGLKKTSLRVFGTAFTRLLRSEMLVETNGKFHLVDATPPKTVSKSSSSSSDKSSSDKSSPADAAAQPLPERKKLTVYNYYQKCRIQDTKKTHKDLTIMQQMSLIAADWKLVRNNPRRLRKWTKAAKKFNATGQTHIDDEITVDIDVAEISLTGTRKQLLPQIKTATQCSSNGLNQSSTDNIAQDGRTRPSQQTQLSSLQIRPTDDTKTTTVSKDGPHNTPPPQNPYKS